MFCFESKRYGGSIHGRPVTADFLLERNQIILELDKFLYSTMLYAIFS